MCCADLRHCCPSGYRCNLVTMKCQKLDQPWLTIPMVKKEAAEKPAPPELSGSPLQELKESRVPDQIKSSVVHCDSYTYCPDGTTCCRHPQGGWTCCPYSPVSQPKHSCAIRHMIVIKFLLSSTDMKQVCSYNNYSFERLKVFFAGQMLSGWLPLLSSWIWLWPHLHALCEGKTHISFPPQASSAFSTCLPHPNFRGRWQLEEGRKRHTLTTFTCGEHPGIISLHDSLFRSNVKATF